MKDRLLYSAIGGCIGAVLTLTFNLFAPLNAQDTPSDAHFGKITCTELEVGYVNPMENPLVEGSFIQATAPKVRIAAHERGGSIQIKGRKLTNQITLDGWDHGGTMEIVGESKDSTSIQLNAALGGISLYRESNPLVKISHDTDVTGRTGGGRIAVFSTEGDKKKKIELETGIIGGYLTIHGLKNDRLRLDSTSVSVSSLEGRLERVYSADGIFTGKEWFEAWLKYADTAYKKESIRKELRKY